MPRRPTADAGTLLCASRVGLTSTDRRASAVGRPPPGGRAAPAPLGAPELLAIPGSLLTSLNSSTPDTAVAEVRAQREQDADFVKAGMMNRPPFLAALEEARRLDLPVDGRQGRSRSATPPTW